MKAICLLGWTLIGAGLGLCQQPKIDAVVNAASNALPGLPNSPIAQGAMFVAYGSNLGPARLVQVSAFPLPTTLSGTSAKVSVNGKTVDAIMIYTVATQIAAVLPSNTPIGTGTITITYNGQTSATLPITVVKSNFGTFTVNQAGSGSGIITYTDYSLVAPDKAANPGETLLIWGTGLGPRITGNEAAGPQLADLTNIPLEVWVGGKLADVSYRGRSGCCTGIDQIAFVVPSGVEACSVPVAVKINDKVSNFTTMPVAANGRICTDSINGTTGNDYQRMSNSSNVSIAQISLQRSITIGTTFAQAAKEDTATANFSRITVPSGGLPALDGVTGLSFGSCLVRSSVGPVDAAGDFSTGPDVMSVPLDAGPSIRVVGPAGTRTLTKSPSSPDAYTVKLGDATPGNYLDPGRYTITGPGGNGVGSFTTTVDVGQPLVWTNQDSISSIDRSNGTRLTWTGGDPSSFIAIFGASINTLGTTATVGFFYCQARVSDGSFTIPPVVLLSLAPTSTVGPQNPGLLGLAEATFPKRFTAAGLDLGLASSSMAISRLVRFQ